MDYKEKLIEWNGKERYIKESTFLKMLVNPRPSDFILDFGCGTGNLAKQIENDSYSFVFVKDINNYLIHAMTLFNDKIDKVNKVYFMHSVAHIKDLQIEFRKLKNFLLPDAYIYIITPNRKYLDIMTVDNYIPDPTVVTHYYPGEIDNMLKGIGYNIVTSGQLGSMTKGINERIFIVAKYG